MKKIQRILFLFILFNLFGYSWPWDVSVPDPHEMSTHQWVQTQTRILKSKASNINSEVLRLSLIAYSKARKNGYDNKQILTVIDYSKPSYEKRMWVFDLRKIKRFTTLGYHTVK